MRAGYVANASQMHQTAPSMRTGLIPMRFVIVLLYVYEGH